ncbi:DNA modification system-associated small protein [Mariniflexile aquimaris]|uniref:DNA modification system-associated small protein n=1 Tax=Mariniflexile aquimaris TaxID=881009 RepID=A0ABW3BTX9_9FLAO
MSNKGLDSTFLHFGIRKEDIQLIESLCEKHQLDFDWVKDFLIKEFHEKKIRNQDIDDKTVIQIIDKALQKIK